MNHAYLIEHNDPDGWNPGLIIIATADEFQHLMDTYSDKCEEGIHRTRWRRLRSHEEIEHCVNLGVEIRAKDQLTPIDWS